jgi:sulfite reductase alpha subunit-like flavoprotein
MRSGFRPLQQVDKQSTSTPCQDFSFNALVFPSLFSVQDCNKVGQSLDTRMAELGGKRVCDLGLADERTGLTEVDPWLEQLSGVL